MALSDLDYVTTGAWGAGLARPLTAAEADGNIHTLRLAIQDIVDNPIEGVSVSNITVSGRQLTFHMSDASTYGPFTLPVVYPRFRGAWEAEGSYAVFDIVTVTDTGTYIVVQDHTADTDFDANASTVDGPLYVQIAGPQNLYAPVLGVSGSTLTLNATHAGKYIRCTNSSGCAVTVPPGVFTGNTEIHFRQSATGAVSFTAGTGVTINSPTGYDLATSVSGDVVTLKWVASNTFDLFGNLVESAP